MPCASSFSICLVAACALSACARSAPVVAEAAPVTVAEGGTCSTSNAQFMLGKTVDQRLAEEARLRAGARVVRVLRPGQLATLEFNPARLNVRVDASGQIASVDCG